MNYIKKKPSLIWNCEGKGKSLIVVKLTNNEYDCLRQNDVENVTVLMDSTEYKIVSMPKHKYVLKK